jgi:hypothetical protein
MSPAEVGVKLKFLKPLSEDPLDPVTRQVDFEACLFARSRQLIVAMESQVVPSKMLRFLVGAMQSVLLEVARRCVSDIAALVALRRWVGALPRYVVV